MKPKIAVLGSINMDLVVTAPRHPSIGETIKGRDFRMIPGGKGANQAVAIARQNILSVFIGCVGEDAFGEQLLNLMNDEGINTAHVRCLDSIPTGIASIVVDDQSQNTIVIASGANDNISQTQLDQASTDIAEAELLICQLETNFDAVEKAIDIAFANKTGIILNPAPVRDLPDDLFPKIDYLIPNETEAGLLTGHAISDQDSAMKAAGKLITKGAKNVLLTMGSQGVYWADSQAVKHFPAFKVKPVDTTAAGDTFVGSFAAGLINNLPTEINIRRAQAAAAISVTKMGAQPSIPTEDEIDLFLKEDS
ncbi:MAG: ribokinase [Proteobacteria bacterium]|nr:ribokinase [Pseudomonadota bacterium]